MTKDQVKEIFEYCGKVVKCQISTGRDKAKYLTSYVQFKYSEDLKTAINVMNKGEIDGKTVYVSKVDTYKSRKSPNII